MQYHRALPSDRGALSQKTKQLLACKHLTTERQTTWGRNDRTARKGEEPTTVAGDVGSPLPEVDRASRQGIGKDVVEPTIDHRAEWHLQTTSPIGSRWHTLLKVIWNSHHTVGHDTP